MNTPLIRRTPVRASSLRRRAASALAASAAALCALPGIAANVTSTWSSAASGVWNANANWTNVPALGGFPNNGNGGVATYDAVISSIGSAYTVTLSTSITVEDLTISSANATLNHTAGTFTATGAITLSAGTYQLSGGTISNTVINVAGGNFLFTSSAGFLSNGAFFNGNLNLAASSAAVRLFSGASFSGVANLSGSNAILAIQDTQTLTGKTINLDGVNARLSIDGTNTVTLDAGTLVRGRGSLGQAQFVGGTSTLLNAGTIRADLAGQTLSINPSAFTNQAGGVVEAINGAVLNVSGLNGNIGTAIVSGAGSQISFNGTNYVNNQTLTVGAGTTATFNGTWSNAAGGQITATGSTLNFNGTWSNAGVMTIDNSTLNLAGSFTTAGLGTINRTGGTVNLTGTLNNAASNLAFSAATGSWNFVGGTISGGQITPGAGGETLLFTSSAGFLSNGAFFNGNLNLAASSAAVRLFSGASFSGVANLSGSNAILAIQDTQTLTGKTINLDGVNARLSIDGTNTVTLDAGTLVRGRGSLGQAQFVGGTSTLLNAGTIRADLAGQTLSISPSAFTNQAGGVVEAINGSTLSISPVSFTNAGTIQALNGSTLTVSGLTGNLGTAIVSGAGSQISFDGTNYVNNQTLTVGAGTTATFNGSYSNSGTIDVAGGTLNLGGTTTTAGLNLAGGFTRTGGTVNLTGTLNNTASTLMFSSTTGSWRFFGGTISGGQIMPGAGGETLLFTSSAGSLTNGAVFNGDLNLSASSARLRLRSGATFTGAATLSGASTILAIEGTQTLAGKTLNLDGSSATLAIDGTTTLTLDAATLVRGRGGVTGGVFVGGTSTLLNAGTIRADLAGQTLSISPSAFTNQAGGVVEAINGSTLSISPVSFTNAGTIQALNGSTLTVSGLTGNLGTAIVSGAGSQISFDGTNYVNNQTLTVGAGTTATFNGSYSNSGTIDVAGGTLNLGGTTTTAGLNLAGGFTRTGGTVNLTGTLNNTASTLMFSSTTGSWRFFGGTISGGQIMPGAGGETLLFTSSAGSLTNGAVFNGDLNLSASSARLRLRSGATFTGAATLSGASTILAIEGTQTLAGKTLNLDGSSATLAIDGTTTLTLDAATLVRGRGGVTGGVFVGGTSTLLNAGTIRADLAGQTLSISPSAFTNQAGGVVEAINGAVLSIPNGYTQTAGVTRVNDGTINSTTINLNAGTLEGSGTINATVNSTGIINLNADGTIAGPLNATGGAWNGQGTVTGLSTVSSGTFTIGSGAHLQANGNLSVTGTGMIAAASATAKITGNVSYLSISNSTFGGILAGAGKTLTMNNAAATFTLAGPNTYTGATTVTAGILKAGIASVSGVSGAFGRNSPVTMANSSSAMLDITGFDTQIGSLSGGGTSGGNVTLGAATLTFAGNNTSPAVYSGNISGNGGTHKIGLGTQTFSGTNAYTGPTTISRGTLKLDFSSLATPTNILNSASTLTLSGGTLSVLGKTGAGVVSVQTLNNLTLSASTFSTIAIDPNNSGAGSTTLTLGNTWTRDPGSTLLIDYSAANTGTRNVRTSAAVTGSGAASANGTFGYALVKDSGGTGFAVQDAGFNLVRNTAPGTVLTPTDSVAGTTGIDFTTVSTDPGYSGVGGTLTLDNVAHAANTLAIDTTGGGTLNLGGATGVLALTSKALLVQGTGNYAIENGALGASGSEVIVHQVGSGTLTISSPISGGAGALTKDGAGTLTLTGPQNYATLTSTAGITNLQMPLGTGSSTIHANAQTNITTSQTLAALNIGEGSVVALTTSGPALAPSAFPDDEPGSGFLDESEMSLVSSDVGSSAHAVPEPGGTALLVAGIPAIFGRRRRAASA